MPNPILSQGDLAPHFILPTDAGVPLDLATLRGERVVLYFYPKDMTPGCTTQACDLQQRFGALTDANYQLLGVSPDPPERHVKFKQKHELGFTLLSDVDHAVAQAYGVWREKKNYGKTYEGIVRSTFVLDEQGRILHLLDNTRAKGHAERLFKLLDLEAARP